ncbi:MAG: tRNA (adenosine(37)-N6)-threonylcarbamoyltransferase complex dimerization subunit type 1 TsaB [Kiloniellales bacterium]|nr:tRNA (adenosine(37)-N6)-threonylcarbamoyltransferase complex dimerization subunit type 1 TsaB [Kiloniellales bacterium]
MTRAIRLLAFDSAGSACSAAIWDTGRVAAARFEAMARGQSERLMPMIEEVMAEAGLDYAGLDALAVTLGPGGFTGVRIGLAAARGLALATGRPLLGLTSFEAVAAAVDEARRGDLPLAVCLDAKRAEVYLQVFAPDLAPLGPPCSLLPEDLPEALPSGPLIAAGDGVPRARAQLERPGLVLAAGAGHADAARFAALAAARPLPPAGTPPPRPLYLRGPDVTLPRPGGAP